MLDIVRKSEFFQLLDQGLAKPNDISLKGIQDGWMLSQLRGVTNSRVMEIGGGHSRVLPQLKGNRLWNAEKFQGVGNGPQENRDDASISVVPAFAGEFSELMPIVDVIFSISVIEHIPFDRYTAAFRDMARCLVPGGIMFHAIDLPLGDQPLDVSRRRIDALIEAVGEAGLVWREVPVINPSLTFSVEMASNSDITMWNWAKVSEASRKSGAHTQIVTIKMIAYVPEH